MQLRSRAWPVLLGLAQEPFVREEYNSLANEIHRDTGVVEVDVQRSLWSYTEGNASAEHKQQHVIWKHVAHQESCGCGQMQETESSVEFWCCGSDAGWADTKRGSSRAQLKALLNAAVGYHQGRAFYYQGLHDIASVLLFEIGERAAFVVLQHLMTNHLRDFTRYHQVRSYPGARRSSLCGRVLRNHQCMRD